MKSDAQRQVKAAAAQFRTGYIEDSCSWTLLTSCALPFARRDVNIPVLGTNALDHLERRVAAILV